MPDQTKLAIKYENLINQSKDLCKKYTGPHSILQIFLEKIINCIGQIALQIKKMTRNELKLWTEKTVIIRKTTASTLQRSSSADSGLLITTTSSHQQNQNDLMRNKIIRQYTEEKVETRIKFKPLLKNIEGYKQFLSETQKKYLFIMNNCAPIISKHFTNMTSVLVEGNSYEFPSRDLHMAIINKLILND